jgi:hypothetical protein
MAVSTDRQKKIRNSKIQTNCLQNSITCNTLSKETAIFTDPNQCIAIKKEDSLINLKIFETLPAHEFQVHERTSRPGAQFSTTNSSSQKSHIQFPRNDDVPFTIQTSNQQQK